MTTEGCFQIVDYPSFSSFGGVGFDAYVQREVPRAFLQIKRRQGVTIGVDPTTGEDVVLRQVILQGPRISVPAGIEEVWSVTSDSQRVASCFPGATMEYCDNQSLTGTVTINFGPISLTYKGTAIFVVRDKEKRELVVEVDARDVRGQSTVNFRVAVVLMRVGDVQTYVDLAAHMAITGPPARFGHSVLLDVGSVAVDEFSSNLANTLTKAGGLRAGKSVSSEKATASAAPPKVASGGGHSAGRFRRGQLDNIVGFTVAIARIEADATLSAHTKGIAILRQLDSTLSTLASQGQLSEEVEEQLSKLTHTALGALHNLSAEVRSTLTLLAKTYQPPITRREKLWHWVGCTILSWRLRNERS